MSLSSRLAAVSLLASAVMASGVEAQADSSAAPDSSAGIVVIGHAGVGWFDFAAGFYLARKIGMWELTPFGASGFFPGFSNGFVRLDTGVNFTSGSGYAGGGMGISAFSYKRSFPFVRTGIDRQVGSQWVRLEVRYEFHDPSRDVILFSAGIPLR